MKREATVCDFVAHQMDAFLGAQCPTLATGKCCICRRDGCYEHLPGFLNVSFTVKAAAPHRKADVQRGSIGYGEPICAGCAHLLSDAKGVLPVEEAFGPLRDACQAVLAATRLGSTDGPALPVRPPPDDEDIPF